MGAAAIIEIASQAYETCWVPDLTAIKWWDKSDLNQQHLGFQSSALHWSYYPVKWQVLLEFHQPDLVLEANPSSDCRTYKWCSQRELNSQLLFGREAFYR